MRTKIQVMRRSRVAPLIVSIERARVRISHSPIITPPERSEVEEDRSRTINQWTPKSCLRASLAGLSLMALEVPLAILYAARRRAIARTKREPKLLGP